MGQRHQVSAVLVLDTYQQAVRDVQQAALLTIGSESIADAREILAEAIGLRRMDGHALRVEPDLDGLAHRGVSLPLWVVETGRGAELGGPTVDIITCRWVTSWRGEPAAETVALTCDAACAAAYLLADLPEVWTDEVLEACRRAVDGWRPALRSEAA